MSVRNQSPRCTDKSPAQGAFRGADQNRTGVAGVTPDPYVRCSTFAELDDLEELDGGDEAMGDSVLLAMGLA